jgi:NAD(P)H dehydrogenase (quinone)
MFAVMGITGNVGGAVANTLLQHGKRVRGIVRNDAKAQAWKDKGVEVVTANYDDHLTAAFTGVEGAFCMIPPDEDLGSTGVPSAFLRAGSFMENILHSIPTVRTTGTYFSFYQPLEHPVPLVATKDIGRIGAETLLQTWQGNRFIEISGPTYYSPNDVAAALEMALDRPVTFGV